MQIPSKTECFQLIREMMMMDHIVDHSMQVCRVATFLARQLSNRHYHLNIDLIRAAAMLHDITKTRSFKTSENHALTGGQFLTERGYPEVGDLVRQHVKLDEYPQSPVVNEVAIINYADKRVLHDQVVTLQVRLEYILERYGQVPEHRQRIRLLWQKTKELEEAIFRGISFSPTELTRLIKPDCKCA